MAHEPNIMSKFQAWTHKNIEDIIFLIARTCTENAVLQRTGTVS
jgi:hypothetical protein